MVTWLQHSVEAFLGQKPYYSHLDWSISSLQLQTSVHVLGLYIDKVL